MKTLIIIPTINEAENIGRLITEIENLNLSDTSILVIDDHSIDETPIIIKNLMSNNKNIYLIERPTKLGLGTAYLTGFNYAINNNYSVAIQMDADFSHNPKNLPKLLAGLEKYDFVVGSRYVRNGGITNWSFTRRLISRLGNLYAQTILGIGLHDLTSGFNAWSIKILKKIDLTKIKSNGYCFQIEMKYSAIKNNFSFLEQPIIFQDRSAGASKMNKKIVSEALWRVWQLRFNNLCSKFLKK